MLYGTSDLILKTTVQASSFIVDVGEMRAAKANAPSFTQSVEEPGFESR